MSMKMRTLPLSTSINLNFKCFILIGLSLIISHEILAQSFEIKSEKIKVQPSKVFDLKSNIKLIEKDSLMKMLRDFVKTSRPSRLVGTDGHSKAQDFILKAIEEADPNKKNQRYVDTFNPDVDYAKKMYWDDFNRQIKPAYKPGDENYKKWLEFTKSTTSFIESKKSFKGKNIIWEKKGRTKPNTILVIGAHYDTIVHNAKTLLINEDALMPGANDNGSGVVIGLSLVELLSKIDLPITVKIVFFDWGELGFLGSKAFVNKYKKEFMDKNYLGLINLDMLGHDSKFLDKTKKYGNMKVYIRRPGSEGYLDDRKLARRIIDLGDQVSPSVNFEVGATHFNNSDNISFWNEGLSALTMTGDWENDFNKERYHSSDDFVETININTFYRAYQYIVGSVMGMAFEITR